MRPLWFYFCLTFILKKKVTSYSKGNAWHFTILAILTKVSYQLKFLFLVYKQLIEHYKLKVVIVICFLL